MRKAMTKKSESSEISIKGNALICTVCKHNKFWNRKTLMNTPGMTFFGLDWANKAAQNYVCENCGYVLWFLNP